MRNPAETPTAYRLGIACTDLGLLRGRLLVATQRILSPNAAEAQGYGQYEAIVPEAPCEPTDEQLEAIIATVDTTHIIHLASLPASIGHEALRLYQTPNANDKGERINLGSGFMGTSLSVRLDLPDQLNVSVDANGVKVGDHIDTYDDADRQVAVLNMGPGVRWHRLTPGFSRDDLNGQRPRRSVRHAHLKNLVAAGQQNSLLSYWIRLDPPMVDQGEPRLDAVLSSPVARYLHDGSTWEAEQESTVVLITMHPDTEAFSYPSLV